MLSSSSPAGLALFPLPSRLPSSSPAGRTSPPSFERWHLASPAFALPSPSQLDFGSFGSGWTTGGRGGGGGWEGSYEATAALSAPAYASRPPVPRYAGQPFGSGTKGIEPKRIFGASGKSGQPVQSKKPKVPVQASQLVAALARRTSSASTAESTTAVAQLDPAFLSNPFFSPFVDSTYAAESFLPTLDDAGQFLADLRPSPAARLNSDGPLGSSSPLQPPTPPYFEPPTPLLKRRISYQQPAVGHGGQVAAAPPTATTSATRTTLPSDNDQTCTIYSLAGVKRRRLLLAEAAAMASDEEDEDETDLDSPSSEPAASGQLARDAVASSMPPPLTSTPHSMPLPEEEEGQAVNGSPSLPAPTLPSLRIRLRVPLVQPDPQPTPSSPTAGDLPSPVAEASSDEIDRSPRKRQLSHSSSISSLESSRHPTPPRAPVLRRTRRRCPTPTMPLTSVTKLQSRKVPLAGIAAAPAVPSPLKPVFTGSKESSLSPSASSPGPTIFDPGPVMRSSRRSSPLSELSSEPGEILPLQVEEDEVVLTGPPAEMRSFPADVDLSYAAEYALWYRRFNVPRTPWPDFAAPLQLPHPTAPTGGRSSSARLSEPRSQGPADLYAPRWIKGIGVDKMGVCPVCFEDGAGYQWHKTKISQFNFHMLYAHGISPTTGLPFSPPLRFRQSDRAQNRPDEKESIREGLCHSCNRWVAVEGVKAVEVNVREIFWWRHAQRCHGSSRIAGDADIWTASPLFARLTNYIDSLLDEEKAGWIVPSEHRSQPAGVVG